MDSATAQRLVELNREFYQTFADEFSATRQRIQPGVRKILSALQGSERLLDLGCGNGETARALASARFAGTYLGLDFSPALLAFARQGLDSARYRFAAADLTSTGRWTATIESGAQFDMVFCFATLHHIPSARARLELVSTVHTLLTPKGRFVHSHWQFLNSEKLKARIQPWESAGIPGSVVEDGDFLLDWRGASGRGLRYVHNASEAELRELATQSDFEIVESFYSDGQGGRLGLYQVWEQC
jgi:SAM-dependent methyltransferase